MNIGIIGGGMMGLATAHFLSQSGISVTVLEKDGQVGGLSQWDEILPGVRWDRYYHVILTTDTDLLEFVKEIGLALDVEFRTTRTGFYINGKMYSMSSTMDFLKFKPLSFFDKMRLGFGLLYASRLNDWQRLEKIYVKTWLTRVFGRRNYEKMWDPLLRAKLGSAAEQTSAAFIWATIKRLYGTRQSGAKKEMMGCVRGGYYSILTHLRQRLIEQGVMIHTGWPVDRLELLDDGRVNIVGGNGLTKTFDKVVATVPNPEVSRLLANPPADFLAKLQSTQYLGVVCMALVLNRSLSSFYVTNLTDPSLPFTGLIEATHVIPHNVFNGKTLIYLPRYLSPGDPFSLLSDGDIAETFIEALKRMFSDFSNDDIIATKINRERYVQPVYSIEYSRSVPPIKTPIKNLYMVNTSMILNSTLNNNQVVQLAKNAKKIVIQDISYKKIPCTSTNRQQ